LSKRSGGAHELGEGGKEVARLWGGLSNKGKKAEPRANQQTIGDGTDNDEGGVGKGARKQSREKSKRLESEDTQ